MPDSEPPQGYPAPAGPELLQRAADLEPETADLVAGVRECIRCCRELHREARRLRRSLRASLDRLARWPC
jgi:hypothetical protein